VSLILMTQSEMLYGVHFAECLLLNQLADCLLPCLFDVCTRTEIKQHYNTELQTIALDVHTPICVPKNTFEYDIIHYTGMWTVDGMYYNSISVDWCILTISGILHCTVVVQM